MRLSYFLKMARFSLQLTDDLDAWLTEQANLNHRSRNKQIEHLLTVARNTIHVPRYATGSNLMCYNGQHYFIKTDPATNEFCNCGVFVFGEVVG